MKSKQSIAHINELDSLILIIRGQRVMLDADLARVYGVTTARLNQQVRRNPDRFPPDFAFQLNKNEFGALMLHNATSKKGRGGRRKLPYVFTEHGAIMAANVLNSKVAATMSVFVVRAFVRLRELMAGNKDLAKKLAELERKITSRLDMHEEAILQLFAEMRDLLEPPPPQPEPRRRRIGFN
jgi:ORF6N domain